MSALSTKRLLLLIITIVLAAIGLFFLFESSAVESFYKDGTAFFFLKKQSFGLAVGIAALIAANFMPVKFYLKFPYLFYIFALIIGVLCLFPSLGGFIKASPQNGAYRWLSIGGISVQTAEIMKFCFIVFFAYLLYKTTDWKVFLSYLAAPVVVLLLQKDLGSLLVILAITFGLYFLAGVDLKILGRIIGVGIVGIIFMILLSPYRRARFLTYLQPEENLPTTGFHAQQLKIGIGRGGLIGQGIGNSQQKLAYVPFASSDSIFSIVSEELGFLGVVCIVFLFFAFLVLIWSISQSSPAPTDEKMIGYGIFFLFASQTFINLAAISGLVPLTGITLPFFSAGGSSLVISLFLVGVVCSLSRDHVIQTIKKKRFRHA